MRAARHQGGLKDEEFASLAKKKSAEAPQLAPDLLYDPIWLGFACVFSQCLVHLLNQDKLK
jgi:hypothetical protein